MENALTLLGLSRIVFNWGIKKMTNNEEINLKVAAIAGWTEIELWNPSASNKTYIGTNAAHPELGKFLPKYTESLDAIWKVFECLGIKDFQVAECSGVYGLEKSYEALLCVNSHETLAQYATAPALALCRLLIAINPDPIAPPQVAIVDDDGEFETVFEAEFV